MPSVEGGVAQDKYFSQIHELTKSQYCYRHFSHDVRAEAIRDDTPAIDLADRQKLVALLKRHQFGVRMLIMEKGMERRLYQSEKPPPISSFLMRPLACVSHL